MSTQAAIDALLAKLDASQGLADFAHDHFGKSWTDIKANREISSFPLDQCPARIVELGDGEHKLEESGTLGNYSRKIETDALLSFAWVEHNPDDAFAQRAQLLDLVLLAFEPYGTLDDAVQGAYIKTFAPDKGVNHPLHFFNFTVLLQYDLLS